MASFSKASQEAFRALKPWLGFTNLKNENPEERRWISQPSLSSGSTTLLGSERSRSVQTSDYRHVPPTSPAKDKAWSKKLRSVASFFYPEDEESMKGSSFECSPKTPERRNPRSPLRALSWNKSSTKSRRDLKRRLHNNVPLLDKSMDDSPTRKTIEIAPVLNVDIPTHTLNEATMKDPFRSVNVDVDYPYDSHAVRHSENRAKKPMIGPAFIWPELKLKDTHEIKMDCLSPGCLGLEGPYTVEPAHRYRDEKESTGLLGFEPATVERVSRVQGLDAADDKGYASDVESNNELESPEANVSPVARAPPVFNDASISYYDSQALRVRFGSTTLPRGNVPMTRHSQKPESIDSRTPISPLESAPVSTQGSPGSPTTPRKSLSLKKSLDYLRVRIVKPFISSQKESATNLLRSPSYAYDADAELSESSLPLPSMGPREEWEKMRLERNKRYVETINTSPAISNAELSNSPHSNCSAIEASHDDSLTTNKVDFHQPDYKRKCGGGHLRFAIEAIERPNADQILHDNSKSSSPLNIGLEREDSGVFLNRGMPRTPSHITTRSMKPTDTLNQSRHVSATSVFRQAWDLLEGDLLPFADICDPYQAALTAAGLTHDPTSQPRYFCASGTSDDDSVFEGQTLQGLSELAEADYQVKQSPSHIVPREILTEKKEFLRGFGAFTDSELPRDAPMQVATHPDPPDKLKKVPFRPKPKPFALFRQNQSPEGPPETNAAVGDVETSPKAIVLEPHVSPVPASAEMALEEAGGWATKLASTSKAEQDLISFSERTQSPHSSNPSEKQKEDSPYFESGFFIMPNDSAFWHDRNLTPLPPPLSPLLEPSTHPLASEKDAKAASKSSPTGREQLGLVKHLEERGARSLMQLVYNLEAESEDEESQADWISESEISRNNTISID